MGGGGEVGGECSSPSSWPTGGLGRCWIAKSVHSCHFSLAWICAPAAGRRNNEYAAAGETRPRTGERRDGGSSVFFLKKGEKKGKIGTVWRSVVSCQREALSRHQETVLQRGRSFHGLIRLWHKHIRPFFLRPLPHSCHLCNTTGAGGFARSCARPERATNWTELAVAGAEPALEMRSRRKTRRRRRLHLLLFRILLFAFNVLYLVRVCVCVCVCMQSCATLSLQRKTKSHQPIHFPYLDEVSFFLLSQNEVELN